MNGRISLERELKYQKFPVVEVEYGEGKHAICANDGYGPFYPDLISFLEHCDAIQLEPEFLFPVVAEWQPAHVSADDILGAIEDQVPDEDNGGDPINERAVAKEAAAAAQKVIDEAGLGAFCPTQKRPAIPEDWRGWLKSQYSNGEDEE